MIASRNALVVVFLSIQLTASGQSLTFESLTEKDGLSDNRVTCFLQDRTGFMWIGTENGLNRYDGHEFRVYRPGQAQYTLSHENINDIAEDSDGRLWIGTWNGLNVLDPLSDSLFVFLPDDDAFQQKGNGIASSITWDVLIDQKERVWLALDIRDLCYYDPATNRFTYFPWKEFVKKTLPQFADSYKSIQRIAVRSDHELWLGTSIGLFSYDETTQAFTYYGGEANDLTSLHFDKQRNQVYFGQSRLFRMDAATNQLHRYESPEQSSTTVRQESLLLPVDNNILMVDPERMQATALQVEDRRLFSVHHNKPFSVLQSKDYLWVGTPNGIRLYNLTLSIFPFVPVFPDTLNHVSGAVYHVLDVESENTYYISSLTKDRLILMDKQTGRQRHITAIGGMPVRRCARTYLDREQRVWVLTEKSLFVSDNKTRTFRHVRFPADDEPALFNDMVEDTEGTLWFSSLMGGVYRFFPAQGKWKRLDHANDGLFASRPTSFLLDSAHNNLWISDYSFGVFVYSFETNTFTYNGMDTSNPNLLQSSLTVSLTLDANNEVWVATHSGGLSKYIHSENRFKTFSMETGLPENTIHSVQTDNNGNIWAASNKGLTCLRPTGEVIRHYDKTNGLPYAHFTTPFSINSKGELLIGINNGFLKFHPDSLASVSPDFPVVITSWEQNTQKLVPTSEHHFRYRENNFVFTFSALAYSQPHQTRYAYQLEGYDESWIEAGNTHAARYTNLSDGTYTFRVRAIDYNGKEGVSQPITFTIAKPFWKTVWFITLVVLAGAYGLYWWTQHLQQRIHAQKILNTIATSLYGQHTLEEVFWKVANSCTDHLGFEDCVVYQVVDDTKLVQKAAAGPKSTTPFSIVNPIEIPVGKGIVGAVAQTGKGEIVGDTRKDKRYIVDDMARLSEIAVPILVDGKVFGVIDSEHSTRHYFTRRHFNMLTAIAAICSQKIGRYFIEDAIRSKVARDLHDDVGSTLSSIKIMSNIAIAKEESPSVRNYLTSILQNADLMQERMSDMVWAINPDNDTMEKVIMRMREFAAEILEPLDIRYRFSDEGNFAYTKLDLATRKDFYLIFKEALNNAAKYSRCRELEINLGKDEHFVTLTIQDHGIGFDLTKTNGGNGLKNMRHRASSIRAAIRIDSQAGLGTTITLQVPIT